MLFQNINRLVMPIGRITPNGINLLGTTFLINKPGYCVAAAHVIKNDDKGLVIIPNKVGTFYDYQDTTDNQIQYIPISVLNVNPFTDICILKIESDSLSMR